MVPSCLIVELVGMCYIGQAPFIVAALYKLVVMKVKTEVILSSYGSWRCKFIAKSFTFAVNYLTAPVQ